MNTIIIAVVACFASFAHGGIQGPCDLLMPVGNGNASGEFGHSVSIYGDTVVVGAWRAGPAGYGGASVYDAITGSVLFSLHPSDQGVNDHFGTSVAIDDGLIIVGSEGNKNTIPPSGTMDNRTGAAFLFNAQTGEQIFKFLASDRKDNDNFGWSVSVSGGFALVGNPLGNTVIGLGRLGAAYIYDTLSGSQIAKLTAGDGRNNDRFGVAVAIDGDILVVGADGDDGSGGLDYGVGSAYVFRYNGSAWAFETKIVADDRFMGDGFGASVSVFGNTILVGAPGNDDNGESSGSVYEYRFNGTDWQQQMKLLPSDGEANDRFGYSVDIENDIAAIGAVGGDRSGGVYHFDLTSGQEFAKHMANDGKVSDSFGSSVSISGNTMVGGADGINSAYLFTAIPSECLADLTGDCSLDFFDVSVFLTYFQLENDIADFTGDGSFDFFDVSAFLQAFSEGCP